MMDKHLKFSSKEEAELTLFDKVDDVFVPKFDFSVDVIGQIYKETGRILTTDQGGVPETKQILGWHVNVRGVEIDDFSEYEVTVDTPVRGWA